MKRLRAIMAAGLLVSGLACDQGAPSWKPAMARPGVTESELPAESSLKAGQTLYVPAYSHVYTVDSASSLNLAVSLFVRNTDLDRPIYLTRVEYFDSSGKSIRSFVARPLRIAPLASTDFFVEESDVTGGPSPSFVVEWVAPEPISEPVVESIMIGTTGSQGISFTGQSRVIRQRKP